MLAPVLGTIIMSSAGTTGGYSGGTTGGLPGGVILATSASLLNVKSSDDVNNLETFKYYCRKNNINIVNIQYENTIICKIQLEENTKSKLINDFETKNINLTNLRFLSKKIINKCKVK